jgi:hypothetical protein
VHNTEEDCHTGPHHPSPRGP